MQNLFSNVVNEKAAIMFMSNVGTEYFHFKNIPATWTVNAILINWSKEWKNSSNIVPKNKILHLNHSL